MNSVKFTEEFEKRVQKMCSTEEQHKIQRFRNRLRQNAWLGDAVGPLWLREMRLDGKRLYFVVDEPAVLFIACSFKNNQQAVIDDVRTCLPEWKLVLQQFKNI